MLRIISGMLLGVLAVNIVAFAADAPQASPAQATDGKGEKVDATLISSGVIESMDVVKARDELRAMEVPYNSKTQRPDHGSWIVPSRRSTFYPHSGSHYATNKWGDTRMGIGFPQPVNVVGAYFSGQGNHGAWAPAVRAIGYRDGKQVQVTDWFKDLDDTAKLFEMNLVNVDRIAIEALPAVESGAGWFAMDDLTYTVANAGAEEGRRTVVVDFEDAAYRQKLSGSNYAGLTWEEGEGQFGNGAAQDSGVVHAPQEGPGLEQSPAANDQFVPPTGGLRVATTPALEDDFQSTVSGGAPGASYVPPDTCGAVGPNHFLTVINSNLSAYRKSAPHTREYSVALDSFLPAAYGDPRVLFDQHSGRWIVLATDFSVSSSISLAVSLTDDPTGSWFKTSWVTASGVDAGAWPDFPTLGVDQNGIYTAVYMVGGAGMTLFAIDKTPILQATPTMGTITAWRGLSYEAAIQPVHTYGTPPGEYVVSTRTLASIRLRRVDPPLTSPTLTTLGDISVPTFSYPPDAPVLGSSVSLDTGDIRIWHTPPYRDGSIWVAHTVASSGRAAIRWYELDTATVTRVQMGQVSDASLSYFYPHLTVNACGDVVIGLAASNASQYAGAYYAGRRADDTAGEMATPVQYRAGQAAYEVLDSYGRNRWGDYSATSLDPDNELTFWTIQEYAHATNTWGTHVARLGFGSCCATPGDLDNDGDYDLVDMSEFTQCFGEDQGLRSECFCANLDISNADVDQDDWAELLNLLTGPQ